MAGGLGGGADPLDVDLPGAAAVQAWGRLGLTAGVAESVKSFADLLRAGGITVHPTNPLLRTAP